MHAYEWLIALRYLLSRERRALLSVITYISVAGVTVGVASLIVVIGVMDGAMDLFHAKLTELFPHVKIESVMGPETPVDPALIAKLRRAPEVAFAEPIRQQYGVIQAGKGLAADKEMVQLLGVDRMGPDTLYRYAGTSKVTEMSLGPGEIVLGRPLAQRIGAEVGGQILLLAAEPGEAMSAASLKPFKLRVRDFYDSGYYDFDANVGFVSKEEMTRMFRLKDGADYIHVKLHDPSVADAFARGLNLPDQYHVTTWRMEMDEFFRMLLIQKIALFIILLLIVLVAAFNIIGTQILMVIEKTREIGILRAIGAPQGAVARVFLIDGMLVGLVGTALGVALGIGIGALIPVIGLQMPESVYNFAKLPVKIEAPTVCWIVASTMIVCTVASLIPARQAARMDPVQALRYD